MKPPPATFPARSQPGWRTRLWLASGLLAYNLLLIAASPFLLAWLLWRALARGKGLGDISHRLGLIPRPPKAAQPRVWLHAVSAGEMSALQPVAEALRDRLPAAHLAVSTITPAGLSLGKRTSRSADALFYLPLDLPVPVLLALLRFRPDLVVVAEKELWPNLLGLARLLGAEVLAVNSRVSDRMMRRARLAFPFVRWLHSLPHHFCAQSQEDAARLARLGVPASRVSVAGNTKVDAMAEPDRAAEGRLRHDLGVSEDDLWLVAGSTHPGEEEVVLQALALLRAREPRAKLLLAPRHLERVPQVLELISARGLPAVRRSSCGTGAPRPAGAAVVLLDTMGELRAAYGLGAAGFVGGTLAPIGGHNLLEPVSWGRAVLFGPHTENCADVADLVLSAGAGFRVDGPERLAETFLRIAGDEARRGEIARRCRELMASQRGAADRCAQMAIALLEEKGA